MTAAEEKLAERLRNYNDSILGEDDALADEIVSTVQERFQEMAKPSATQIDEESIILRKTRPVLAVKAGTTELVFEDKADTAIWKERLDKAKAFLDAAIRAVGRIDLAGHPDYAWVGTGWLIAPDVIVTNRHVANAFAMRNGRGFTFQIFDGGPVKAAVDFLQEINRADKAVFELERVLHIEDADGPDLAFLRVKRMDGGGLAEPIRLASKPVVSKGVATIGYPAYDSRIPERDLMERIYGRVYDKKRLAPGAVTKIDDRRVLHNCTTLGGNSGSVVLDLSTGEAIGLHFSGSFLVTNYAVRSDVVARRLKEYRTKPSVSGVAPKGRGEAQSAETSDARVSVDGASITIPLTISVSLGGGAATSVGTSTSAPPQRLRIPDVAPDDAVDGDTEAKPADYDNRDGYDPGFLGKKLIVPLPEVLAAADDVLTFEDRGKKNETELRYEHYSVVMSRSRRMCFFSACNINGGLARKDKRVAWKWDPRIPKAQQIMKECYGNPPKKFSRGHMTRREDPGWGATSKRGNEDSMHVTNTTPQLQAFNSPIWLALEDYALGHAKDDDMNISVFTGPYFGEKDRPMYGVRIPVAFWKIIAFIHEETGELCATGYEMSQEANLKGLAKVEEEEFVFGNFISPHLNIATQVPIHAIEMRSGIDFGPLAAHDPFTDDEGPAGGGRPPLLSLEQIRFR